MNITNLANPIRLGNPSATGVTDSYLPNTNAVYGPYSSLDVALTLLTTMFYDTASSKAYIPLGCTVAILTNGTLAEYWNPTVVNPTKTSDFVLKGGGTGSSTIKINVTTTTYTNSADLNTAYPSADIGTIVVSYTDDSTAAASMYVKTTSTLWVKFTGTLLSLTAAATATIAAANILSYK